MLPKSLRALCPSRLLGLLAPPLLAPPLLALPFLALPFLVLPAWADRPLTEAEVRAVASAVKSRVRDPATAQFLLGPWLGGQIYCGLVDTPDDAGTGSLRHLFAVTFLPGGPGGISQAYLKGLSTTAGAPETTLTLNLCAHAGYRF